MEAVFLKLLNMSITAGWLVLAVVVLRLALKKAPRRLTVLLWALVAVRLVCPFSFESRASVIPSAEPIPAGILMAREPALDTGVPVLDQAVNPVLAESMAPQVGDGVNPMQVAAFLASRVWVLGMAAMAVYCLVSVLRLRKRVAEAVLLRENIYVCDRISDPFVFGVFRPRIYFPADLVGEDLEYVLLHERAHLKRGDHLWKPLGFCLLTVYWFSPLLWLAYCLLCRDIELACDERVLREQGTGIKKAYAEALIACSAHRKTITACPLAFGETGVKQRVKNILRYRKTAVWAAVIAVAVLIGSAVCLLTDPVRPRAGEYIHANGVSEPRSGQFKSDLTQMPRLEGAMALYEEIMRTRSMLDLRVRISAAVQDQELSDPAETETVTLEGEELVRYGDGFRQLKASRLMPVCYDPETYRMDGCLRYSVETKSGRKLLEVSFWGYDGDHGSAGIAEVQGVVVAPSRELIEAILLCLPEEVSPVWEAFLDDNG